MKRIHTSIRVVRFQQELKLSRLNSRSRLRVNLSQKDQNLGPLSKAIRDITYWSLVFQEIKRRRKSLLVQKMYDIS